MSSTKNDGEQVATLPSQVREDIVNKAVDFLLHPKVADTPVNQKAQFLREKKGLTPAEVAVALQRSGLPSSSTTNTPNGSKSSTAATGRDADFFRPLVQQPTVAPPAGWGVGAVLLTAGLAAAVGGALVWMGNQWVNAVWGTDEEQGPPSTPSAKQTPASARKRRKKKKKKQQMEEVNDLKEAFTAAFQEQARQNTEVFASVQSILDQVEENNKLRVESYRSAPAASASNSALDDAARNDLQTIKQLLLTRQISGNAAGISTSAPSSSPHQQQTSSGGGGIVIPSKPALPSFMKATQDSPSTSTSSSGIEIPSKPALPAFMQTTPQAASVNSHSALKKTDGKTPPSDNGAQPDKGKEEEK